MLKIWRPLAKGIHQWLRRFSGYPKREPTCVLMWCVVQKLKLPLWPPEESLLEPGVVGNWHPILGNFAERWFTIRRSGRCRLNPESRVSWRSSVPQEVGEPPIESARKELAVAVLPRGVRFCRFRPCLLFRYDLISQNSTPPDHRVVERSPRLRLPH